MKCNKKMLVVAAAGALTVATAVPALALENDFHGLFRTYYDNSNFTVNAAGTSLPGSGTTANTKADQNANFFETRLRLNYTAKVNNDVQVVSRFETNYRYWGNSSYTSGSSRLAGRAEGGALGSRGVNLETKQVYLDLNLPDVKLNTKIGMQPWTDDYQGIFADSDMPGVLLTHAYDKSVISAGFFRWDDADKSNSNANGIYGSQTRDLYTLSASCEQVKDAKFGASYYYLRADLPTGNPGDIDNSAMKTELHMVGLNGQGLVGPVNLDGFVVGQFGRDHMARRDIAAFAANAGAKMAVGKGTARANVLFVSGDDGKGTDSSWHVASYESDFYNNEMVVLGRDKYAMVNDNAIVQDQRNGGQGVIFGALGYDMNFTDKLSGSANLGFAATAKQNLAAKPLNQKTGVANDSDYLGTEVNGELGYKLNANTALAVRAGYVFLGDYYKNTASDKSTPDNVYDAKLVVTVVF